MFDFTNWWITWKSFWATIGAKAGQPKINEAVLNAVLARSVDLNYSDLLALAYASYAEDAGVAVEELDQARLELIQAKLNKALAARKVVESNVEGNLLKEGLKKAGINAQTAKRTAKRIQKRQAKSADKTAE